MITKLTTRISHSKLKVILFATTVALSLLGYILPDLIHTNVFSPQLGEVAVQAIEAPKDISYVSEIKTTDAKARAENSVLPVYSPADPSIARKQLEQLRIHLNFITMVREDGFADNNQKLDDLAGIGLDSEVSGTILALSANQWEVVQQESQLVLEEVMRNSIREDRLSEYQRSVPTLISLNLSSDQAHLTATLVTPLVSANSLFSEELTRNAIVSAREAVEPVVQTYLAGETIVQRGQVITPSILEALQEIGVLTAPRIVNSMLAGGALHIVLFGFVGFFFYRRKPKIANNIRNLIIISYLYLLFLISARLLIVDGSDIQYLFPVAAFGMTISSIFSGEIGLVFSLVLSILLGFGFDSGLELSIFYMLSSICGSLVLGRARRIANFFWAAIVIGGVGAMVLIANRLPISLNDWGDIAGTIGLVIINGLASASIALLLQYLVAHLLGLATGIQLLDLSRPDHPLLQRLLREAPGTYQHSLQVANLAEQAAEAIGADTLLVHVGSLYHDCGKSNNPGFFIENQVPGNIDAHDQMEPKDSARIIIRHVADGVALAKKYRLPERIQDFIKEHHGSLLTRYQYVKAIEKKKDQFGDLNPDDFRYPGPAPRSRETAILMLSDGMEARARSELPKGEEGLRTIAQKVIIYCQEEGQLDQSGLSLGDLKTISESFTSTLLNTYHPRIQYPEINASADINSQAEEE